ncbi:MAG: hypothetical protein V3W41_22770 [Planctomycetota bacterium]
MAELRVISNEDLTYLLTERGLFERPQLDAVLSLWRREHGENESFLAFLENRDFIAPGAERQIVMHLKGYVTIHDFSPFRGAESALAVLTQSKAATAQTPKPRIRADDKALSSETIEKRAPKTATTSKAKRNKPPSTAFGLLAERWSASSAVLVSGEGKIIDTYDRRSEGIAEDLPQVLRSCLGAWRAVETSGSGEGQTVLQLDDGMALLISFSRDGRGGVIVFRGDGVPEGAAEALGLLLRAKVN